MSQQRSLKSPAASKLARPAGQSGAASAATSNAAASQQQTPVKATNGKALAALEKSARAAGLTSNKAHLYAKKLLNAPLSHDVDGGSDEAYADYKIGDRVYVAGVKPGVIAFIGDVQFSTGEWVGVVLDAPEGKNDGSVNGVPYFMCEPKRGIFSKLSKLSKTPRPPVTSPESNKTNTDGQVAPSRESNQTNTSIAQGPEDTSSTSAGLNSNNQSATSLQTSNQSDTSSHTASQSESSNVSMHDVDSNSTFVSAPTSLGSPRETNSTTNDSNDKITSSSSLPVNNISTNSASDTLINADPSANHVSAVSVNDNQSTNAEPASSVNANMSANNIKDNNTTANSSEANNSISGGIRTGTPDSSHRPSQLPRRTSVGSHTSSRGGSPSGSAKGSLADLSGGRLQIGVRVRVSGNKVGVLRFLGGTDFAKGQWAGVELEDPVGKNDGSVAGKRYFTCKALHGLFAPLGKVEPYRGVGVRQRLGGGGGRYGSQESVSSLGSAASTASRSGARMRLGVTSLSNQIPKTRGPAISPNLTALQKALKEKEEHIEQLLKERDLERHEFTRGAAQMDEIERENIALKTEHDNYVKETGEIVMKLKSALDKVEKSKNEYYNQLIEEKRKAEDLQFSVEEVNIEKSDLQSKLEKLEKNNKKNRSSESDEFFLDQIEELIHKLSVAESQLQNFSQSNTDNIPTAANNSSISAIQAERDGLMKENFSLQKLNEDNENKIQDLLKQVEMLSHSSSAGSIGDQTKERLEVLVKQINSVQSERDSLKQELDLLKSSISASKQNETVQTSFKEQFEDLQKRHTEAVKNWDLEKSAMIEVTKNLVKERDEEIERLQRACDGEMGGDMGGVSRREADLDEKRLLQQRIRQLEQALTDSETNANITLSNASSDVNWTKLLADKEAQDKQVLYLHMDFSLRTHIKSKITFLNSVIIDLQRKKLELEMKLEALLPNVNSPDVNLCTNSSNSSGGGEKKRDVKQRLFCDICEVFDEHDTDDCPQQESNNSSSIHRGEPPKRRVSRNEERPYCTNCEVFGHTVDNCEDDQTF